MSADKLDHSFNKCPITDITAMELQGYIKWRRREGDAEATIRRQLGRLRSAFNRAKALDFIKVGQFKPSSVTQIAEKSDAR
ncbi:MAG: hypothetical protein DMG51_07075 [Acidobacteria bacterium]|nr:MAG: hypothetical protein DMG51_07075 [Acidobacteriota bacterium]